MKALRLSAATLIAAATIVLAQTPAVDWKTIAAEFAEDDGGAQAKYQDQVLTVTGPVSGIAAGDMTVGNPSVAVTLSAENGPAAEVKLLFENMDLEPNTEIQAPDDAGEALLIKRDSAGNVISSAPIFKIGQQITVTGDYIDFSAGSVVLRHCRLGAGSTP
jgi:hypothetical protein